MEGPAHRALMAPSSIRADWCRVVCNQRFSLRVTIQPSCTVVCVPCCPSPLRVLTLLSTAKQKWLYLHLLEKLRAPEGDASGSGPRPCIVLQTPHPHTGPSDPMVVAATWGTAAAPSAVPAPSLPWRCTAWAGCVVSARSPFLQEKAGSSGWQVATCGLPAGTLSLASVRGQPAGKGGISRQSRVPAGWQPFPRASAVHR